MQVIEYGPITDKNSFVEILSRYSLMDTDLYFIVVKQYSPFSYYTGSTFYHDIYAIGKPYAYKFVCALKGESLYHDSFTNYHCDDANNKGLQLHYFILIGKPTKIATRLHASKKDVETEDD